jgi:hypothetical protein
VQFPQSRAADREPADGECADGQRAHGGRTHGERSESERAVMCGSNCTHALAARRRKIMLRVDSILHGYFFLRLATDEACLPNAVRVFRGSLLIVRLRFADAAALRTLRRAAERWLLLAMTHPHFLPCE